MDKDVGPLTITPAQAGDRARLARIRPDRTLAPFVHWNHFWLDRALGDPAIEMYLLRAAPRLALVGCMALGPHEATDLDPDSRLPGVGEIYHLIIHRDRTRRGFATQAIGIAVQRMRAANPALHAVRLSHHPDNAAAAALYEGLGFVEIGFKTDAETGLQDVLRELRLRRE